MIYIHHAWLRWFDGTARAAGAPVGVRLYNSGTCRAGNPQFAVGSFCSAVLTHFANAKTVRAKPVHVV
jgi:hypothetical protein